jgi:hypothetical protein
MMIDVLTAAARHGMLGFASVCSCLPPFVARSQRVAHANQIADMQATFQAKYQVAVERIRELEARLKAEHDAFVTRISELEGTVEADGP